MEKQQDLFVSPDYETLSSFEKLIFMIMEKFSVISCLDCLMPHDIYWIGTHCESAPELNVFIVFPTSSTDPIYNSWYAAVEHS